MIMFTNLLAGFDISSMPLGGDYLLLEASGGDLILCSDWIGVEPAPRPREVS